MKLHMRNNRLSCSNNSSLVLALAANQREPSKSQTPWAEEVEERLKPSHSLQF